MPFCFIFCRMHPSGLGAAASSIGGPYPDTMPNLLLSNSNLCPCIFSPVSAALYHSPLFPAPADYCVDLLQATVVEITNTFMSDELSIKIPPLTQILEPIVALLILILQ